MRSARLLTAALAAVFALPLVTVAAPVSANSAAEADIARWEAEIDRLTVELESAEAVYGSAGALVDEQQVVLGEVAARLAAAEAKLAELDRELEFARAVHAEALGKVESTRAELEAASALLTIRQQRLDAEMKVFSEQVSSSYQFGSQRDQLMVVSAIVGGSLSDISRGLTFVESALDYEQQVVDQTATARDAAADAQRQVAWLELRMVADERLANGIADEAERIADEQREVAAAIEADRQAEAEILSSLNADARQALSVVRSLKGDLDKAKRELSAAKIRANGGVEPAFGDFVRVRGITVHKSIGHQLAQLLADAEADGVVMGGYGYRSPETTAYLRIVNGCPDVYISPASSCRVPTARPGTSMHEKGLAIDFTYNGQTICYPYGPDWCRRNGNNRAFNWLDRNATKYGLYGLSTEAWHYSTNGR